jgi:hypothetical protein
LVAAVQRHRLSPSKWTTTTTNNSMKQSPTCKANSRRSSQDIPRILWNPKAHNRVHKIPPRAPIPTQTNSIHTPQHYVPNERSILILSAYVRLRLLNILFPSNFQLKFCTYFSFPHELTLSSYLIWLSQ